VTSDTWSAVDRFVVDTLSDSDPVLDAAQRAADTAGLPAISVSAAQGKFLHLLARIRGARRILEIGTLAGYSTIWLARALPPGGQLITLEYDPRHADVARANIALAGLADRVEVRVGRAIEALPGLVVDEPFDLIFIDADKPNNPHYLEWAIRLSRPGTVIILDNVVREGRVVEARSQDRNVKGARAAFELLKTHPRVDSTALQTVGLKGWDGFILGLVKAT
jgi:predicted O-methyltransferase YrrM